MNNLCGPFVLSAFHALLLWLWHPRYSETCIKQTPSIKLKQTVAEVPKFIALICFK